ncbi:MAG TPA: LLM class F420-dependent oxidoreductase [Ilumatobacteraceae bacterium]|jgi:F420-dependent oxidoreductase-like protein|nr:LLM class F420-dependent oxidoreductase [Ilumatobacteraceae bacterium]
MQLSDLCVFTEPQQGATYDMLLAVAQRAEILGYGGFFRSDHFLAMGGVSGLPGPTDAWVTLAGLARDTSRIRLGTLVTPITFRGPGLLAISVAQVDRMSDGRIELGIGAGWYEAEHTAYGFPFPDAAARFDDLEDQLAIIEGLWNTPIGETFSYSGKVHSVVDSPGLPKPVQDPLPIIMGGGGPTRTPALSARYATEYNVGFQPVAKFIERKQRIDAACAAVGRGRPMKYSLAIVVCAGATEDDVARRAAAIGQPVEKLREAGVAGSAEEVAAKLREYIDAGCERFFLQILDVSDLDHLDFIADEVAPLLA